MYYQGNLPHLTDAGVLVETLGTLNQLDALQARGVTSFYTHLTRAGFLADAFIIRAKFGFYIRSVFEQKSMP